MSNGEKQKTIQSEPARFQLSEDAIRNLGPRLHNYIENYVQGRVSGMIEQLPEQLRASLQPKMNDIVKKNMADVDKIYDVLLTEIARSNGYEPKNHFSFLITPDSVQIGRINFVYGQLKQKKFGDLFQNIGSQDQLEFHQGMVGFLLLSYENITGKELSMQKSGDRVIASLCAGSICTFDEVANQLDKISLDMQNIVRQLGTLNEKLHGSIKARIKTAINEVSLDVDGLAEKFSKGADKYSEDVKKFGILEIYAKKFGKPALDRLLATASEIYNAFKTYVQQLQAPFMAARANTDFMVPALTDLRRKLEDIENEEKKKALEEGKKHLGGKPESA